MGYTSLSKLYYKSKKEYSQLCEQRKKSETTHFLPIQIHKNQAFFCFCSEIYDLSAQIMTLDKYVSLLQQELPVMAIAQFAKKCLIDEIKLSCDIEHVYSTRKELSETLESLGKKRDGRFYGLVNKYSLLNKEDLSLKSCSDIRKIYDELVFDEVASSDPENIPDGVIFRKNSVEVNSSSQKLIHRGVYPEAEIIRTMEQALHIVDDLSIPALIRISIFHYLFGYIHPFYDGNGRTSRFISSYLLSQEFDFLIGYRLSYTIKENLTQYYKAFQECNDEKNCGDLTPFVIMFLSIIRDSFSNLLMALQKRSERLSYYRGKMGELGPFSEDEDQFFDIVLQATLFSESGITRKELGEVLEISPSTVNKRLAKLRETGLLLENRVSRSSVYTLDLEGMK